MSLEQLQGLRLVTVIACCMILLNPILYWVIVRPGMLNGLAIQGTEDVANL